MKLTTTYKRLALGLGLAFFLTSSLSNAFAQDRPARLANVSKVTTLVDFGSTGQPPPGVSEDRLRTVLELRLRSAGLRVISQEEDAKDPNLNPYLFLYIRSLETRSQGGKQLGFAYRADLSARIFHSIPFNRARAPVEIWVDGTLAVGSDETASTQLERIVNQLADSFLNEWLAANPKK